MNLLHAFAVAMLTLVAEDPDPAALIRQLGANASKDREEAEAALRALGRPALPALRLAGRDSTDLEIKLRSSKLVEKIEHDCLTKPTLVKLDVDDRPVSEVLKSLGDAHRFAVANFGGGPDESLGRIVNIRNDRPIPLLDALDQVCRAGSVRFEYFMVPIANSPFAQPLQFMPAGKSRAGSGEGPFRVRLSTLSYSLQRDRYFDPKADEEESPAPTENCFLWMLVLAEPRLRLKCLGNPKVLEAVDDRGQSMVLEGEEDESVRPRPVTGFQLDGSFKIGINLQPRTHPGASIKRLRGSIPVEVAELGTDTLAIPLDGAAGKTFEGPEATVEVKAVNLIPAEEAPARIELTIRSKFHDLDIEQPDPDFPIPLIMPSFLAQQLIPVSDEGKRVFWTDQFKWIGPREVVVTLTAPIGAVGNNTPAKLLVCGIMRTRAEIPFDFRDIPLP